jgi:uncharacterized protein (TIGR02118 family)
VLPRLRRLEEVRVPKHIVVLWRPAEIPLETYTADLLGRADAALARRPTALTIDVADGPRSPISRRRADGAKIGGLASVQSPDATTTLAIAATLDPTGRHHAVYAVDEAVPVQYHRDWPLRARSPGIKQTTFLNRRPGMSDDEFIAYWHGTHTPLAIEVHPLWRYVRNVVRASLTAGAPHYDGIVELQFRSVEDVTDSHRFYGGKLENAQRIATDVRNFIDFETIDISHMSEIVFA